MSVRFHEQVTHLLVDIDEVKRHPDNPREGDVDAIVESIEVNGFIAPVIVQKSTGYIVAGNHRYEALLALGETRIPVIQVDVDDQMAKRYLIADNRTSDLGRYDEQALVAALLDLQASEIGLAGTAYTDAALELLLTDPAVVSPGGFGVPHTMHTVVVECSDPAAQRAVIDLLAAAGFTGRAVNY